MARVWDDFLTPRDREVFQIGGWGQRQGFGQRPALVIVDVTYDFCGERDEPLLDAARHLRTAVGHDAWECVRQIQPLLAAARNSGLPVVFTTMLRKDEAPRITRWGSKNSRAGDGLPALGGREHRVVDEIAPLPGEILIKKAWPSAFFGTPLIGYLNMLAVDSLIVCGGTTSGCVRATVTDAFSHNYLVTVVEDCTFDRGQLAHAASLFDMDQKYADVISLAEVLQHLNGLPPRGG